eukprot:PITA_32055
MDMLEEIYRDGDVQREIMDVPGFRFYPTEEELLRFYLTKRVQCDHPLEIDMIIPTLDLYQYDPWQLPRLPHVGDRQSFFFVPRVHRKSSGRLNRLTLSGFWKSTGTDRAIRNELLHCIGIKKTLVFYKGKALGAQKTEWIMNEYRLPDFSSSKNKKHMDMVLCRIYRKTASQKSLEQPAKPNHVEKEDPAFSGRDKYEENLSNSFTLNGSYQLQNATGETGACSLHSQNQETECSSYLSNASDEDSLFECLEPVMFCDVTKACKQQQLELPTLPLDWLFNHEAISSPWADNINAWTPYGLLSTP